MNLACRGRIQIAEGPWSKLAWEHEIRVSPVSDRRETRILDFRILACSAMSMDQKNSLIYEFRVLLQSAISLFYQRLPSKSGLPTVNSTP